MVIVIDGGDERRGTNLVDTQAQPRTPPFFLEGSTTARGPRPTYDLPHPPALTTTKHFRLSPANTITTRGSSISTTLSLAPRPRPRPTHPRLTPRDERRRADPQVNQIRATTSYPLVPSSHRGIVSGASHLSPARVDESLQTEGGGGFHSNVGNRGRSQAFFGSTIQENEE